MKVLLLDAYNLIHRAKSGFKKGDNPIVYNFFRSLRPIIEKFSPDKVYFVLEGYPKHRNVLLTEYKGNRPTQSDSFKRQKATILNIMKNYFPVECIYHPDFECDDVIGTLTFHHSQKGDDCTVISSDTDFIQLYNVCNVTLYNPIKKSNVPKPGYDYVTWKALRGDKSDNILGIRGIGDKKALALVNDKKALFEFLKNEEHMEIFEKNVNLIRLVNLSDASGEFVRYPEARKWEEARDAFDEMGFSSLINGKPWNKFVTTFSCVKY